MTQCCRASIVAESSFQAKTGGHSEVVTIWPLHTAPKPSAVRLLVEASRGRDMVTLQLLLGVGCDLIHVPREAGIEDVDDVDDHLHD
jgi:hypothetical protein